MSAGMAKTALVMILVAYALGSPDWTDCPSPCSCKWTSGKKTAMCKDAGYTDLPPIDDDIQILDLSDNTIHILGQEAFKKAGLLNLQKIFLRHTQLQEVHPDAFKELIILIELDLSYNEISTLHPQTFTGNERLKVLYLTGNPLRELQRLQFPDLPHLRALELESCDIHKIHRDAFANIAGLELLNLKANQLVSLSEKAFMNLHLKSLEIDGNPWRCDCNLRVFRNWFLSSNLRSTSLICNEPETVSGMRWDDVKSQDFACAPQVLLSTQAHVQAEAGANVSFGCHVIGDPEPKVTWLYNDNPVNHTWAIVEAEEGILDKWANISVYNVSDVDAGVYSCVAKNSLAVVSENVTLELPVVVIATTLSKTDTSLIWWAVVGVSTAVLASALCTTTAVCCIRKKNTRRRSNMKASVSFNDQEKKLLDVSIATTTDRGTGSMEAIGPDMELLDPPVHITIENEPLPMAVFPPPPEFSTSVLPAGAFGNIFISVSVSRDPNLDLTRCPDLLDLPHRSKPVYHGMATLPRRPHLPAPQYDNMGPRVTAGGSSTLSLPDSTAELPPPPPPPASCIPLTPEFVSL